MLAISTDKSRIRMVDTETWESHDLEVPYRRHSHFKHSIALSPDGRFVYSAGASHDMWHRLSTVSGLVCGGATMHNGTRGCTCRSVGEGFSDVVDDDLLDDSRPSDKPHCRICNDYVHSIALSPDGKFLVTTYGDHVGPYWDGNHVDRRADILIWNTETSAIEHVIHDTGVIDSLAISADGSRIAVGKKKLDRTDTPLVIVWDIKTGEMTHRYPCNFFELENLSFSPYSSSILAISSGVSTRQIHLDNGSKLGFSGRICKYSPRGDVVATSTSESSTSGSYSGEHGSITIFSTISGQQLRVKHNAHKRDITDLCWSPDGGKIASCCANYFHENDHNCKVWDSSTFHLIHSIDTSCQFGSFVGLSWGPNWKRALDRRLACAMALHDRIGNGSLLKHLPPDLLRIMAWDAEHE